VRHRARTTTATRRFAIVAAAVLVLWAGGLGIALASARHAASSRAMPSRSTPSGDSRLSFLGGGSKASSSSSGNGATNSARGTFVGAAGAVGEVGGHDASAPPTTTAAFRGDASSGAIFVPAGATRGASHAPVPFSTVRRDAVAVEENANAWLRDAWCRRFLSGGSSASIAATARRDAASLYDRASPAYHALLAGPPPGQIVAPVANGTALDLSDVAGLLPADADIHPTFCTYWAHFPFPSSPLGSAATGKGIGQVSSGGFDAVTGQAHSTAPLPIRTITNKLDPVYVELAFTASGGSTTEAYHVWMSTVLDFARSGRQFALAQYWTNIACVALDEVVGSAPSGPSWVVAEPHGGIAVMKPPHMIAARPVG